jgi:hypothetical protein
LSLGPRDNDDDDSSGPGFLERSCRITTSGARGQDVVDQEHRTTDEATIGPGTERTMHDLGSRSSSLVGELLGRNQPPQRLVNWQVKPSCQPVS